MKIRVEDKKIEIYLEFDKGNEHVIFSASFSSLINVPKSYFNMDDKGLFS